MKKFLFWNTIIILILVLVLFICFEFYVFYTTRLSYKKNDNIDLYYNFKMESYKNFYEQIFKKKLMRPIENIDSNLNPILIFGCSFAYGDNLKDDETFSYFIGKYVKNPVYNFALGGWSIANTLYQAKNEQMLRQLKKEPCSIIYVYTPVQLFRMYLHVFDPGDNHLTVHYDYKNGILKEIEPSLFLYSFYSIKKIDNAIAMYKAYNKNSRVKNQEILTAFFSETIKEFKKYYKNTKYYIFVYSNTKEPYIEDICKKTDWQVIYLSDIVDIDIKSPEYTISETDRHPNKKAWELITKPFLKKINLI